MSNRKEIRDLVVFDCKGVTPKYVKHSNTIVLNQKCIKEFKLDYSLAQFISQEQKISEEKIFKGRRYSNKFNRSRNSWKMCNSILYT